MATRALRTDSVANIADFGAIANNPGAAAINAAAFRAALDVSRRVTIPVGLYYFEQILYGGNLWLPPGVEIFGQSFIGATNPQYATRLVYVPTNTSIPAFRFAPDVSRSTLHDFFLSGPVEFPNADGIGISFVSSQLNYVRDVVVSDFRWGVEFHRAIAPVDEYSGNNVLERFEVNRCSVGIVAEAATNACYIGRGRINASLDIGLWLAGTPASPEPAGPSAITIIDVNIEPAATCLRIDASRDVSVIGCYFEPGQAVGGEPRRRSVVIDAASQNVQLIACQQSEGSGVFAPDSITPSYFDLPPEAEALFQGKSFPQGNVPGDRGRGAAYTGATANFVNRIRNGDMSRGAMHWPQVGAGTVTPNTTDFVTGRASQGLQVLANPLFHIAQEVSLDTGVRSVTACVRYRLLTAPNAFRIELFDVDAATPLGYFLDDDAGPTGWRVRALRARFEDLATGIVGPRRMELRIYPFSPDSGLAPNAQEVLVDAAWLIDGEYATSFRSYTAGEELLTEDDRDIFLSGAAVTLDLAPTQMMPASIPANAIGMVVEITISSAAAATVSTFLQVNDGQGTSPSRQIYALANNRPTLVEYTVPLRLPLSPATYPTWSTQGAAVGNAVTYAVRLKRWILAL